jgi:hypothetical protein
MQQKSVPTWEGLWTGGHFLQIIAGDIGGVRRLFAYVLNFNNQIELWELDDHLDGGHGGDRDARMAATVQYRNVVDILEGKKLSAQHFAPRKLMAVLQNPGDDNHEPYNVARAHYYAIGPKTRSAWRPPLRSQTDKAGVAGWGRRNKSKRR